ncbi:MAG: preprotein translocase subunit Sec61beta [Candidatus Bathyarchaeota archaeon B23]|nr:MAG: preprotein translocase subunit Sec61beta [Candidatus Bathyarchaeota archaeon B23]
MGRRRRESGVMPAASAGLIRFFQEEAHGLKISPEMVVTAAIMLIIAVVLAHSLLPQLL